MGHAAGDDTDAVGYGPDVTKNRTEARGIMEKLGYGPDKRLAVTVTTRNVAAFRDPAVILISQLKEIYIDGTLNPSIPRSGTRRSCARIIPSPSPLPKPGSDPDQIFYDNYYCGSERNCTGYCNPEADKLIDHNPSRRVSTSAASLGLGVGT